MDHRDIPIFLELLIYKVKFVSLHRIGDKIPGLPQRGESC